jgi:glycosyltransferase involved in cell wall biosynthesis
MKLLWFSDTATPAVRDELGIVDTGNRAGWVANAARALAARDGIELGIVWASPLVSERRSFVRGNVTYFCVPKGGWMQSVSRRLGAVPPARRLWQALTFWPRQSTRGPLRDCRRIVDEYRPDLVHVHGTESFYGLLGGTVDVPVIVTLQGILIEYAKVYWGNVPGWKRPLMPREFMSHLRMKRNARREAEIIRRNRYFSGRTHWDREVLLGLNPGAKFYSDGARLLRPDFYGPEWSLQECTRHRLYTTMTARPYKGTDVLVEALALLRQDYPDITLRVGGDLPDSGYGRYVRTRVQRLGLGDRVSLLGFVEAADIVRELRSAHAYVLGSYIENSPNSVAEAQTIGTPCIATASGGTPSMVEHQVTGLLYEPGDAATLARHIDRVFSDDKFAGSLSARERAHARERGAIESNTDTLIGVYRAVLEDAAR